MLSESFLSNGPKQWSGDLISGVDVEKETQKTSLMLFCLPCVGRRWSPMTHPLLRLEVFWSCHEVSAVGLSIGKKLFLLFRTPFQKTKRRKCASFVLQTWSPRCSPWKFNASPCTAESGYSFLSIEDVQKETTRWAKEPIEHFSSEQRTYHTFSRQCLIADFNSWFWQARHLHTASVDPLGAQIKTDDLHFVDGNFTFWNFLMSFLLGFVWLILYQTCCAFCGHRHLVDVVMTQTLSSPCRHPDALSRLIATPAPE